jgi:2-oxoglutarate dehydrogenase E1 component
MTVAVPSTPGSYFHLLRRQVRGNVRRPLVVFTPKSMLRLKAAASTSAELTEHGFRPVIGDEHATTGVRRVVITAGKLHYDLAAAREKLGVTDVALLRLEQLYPLPADELRAALAEHGATADVVWAQEEPANQGAWPFIALHLPELLADGQHLRRISRREAASPASGSAKVHELEQQALLDAVFSA